jgi:hypothetical protein
VALGDRRPGADPVEGADEAERGAGQVVRATRAGEVDRALVQAGLGLDRGQHRHQHLDLVLALDPAGMVRLGEGDDGDVTGEVRHHTCSRYES